MKLEFLVVFEKGMTSFGAPAPDIPGCFAVGSTLDETRTRFLEAAKAHLQWIANDGDAIPRPKQQLGLNWIEGQPEKRTNITLNGLQFKCPLKHARPSPPKEVNARRNFHSR